MMMGKSQTKTNKRDLVLIIFLLLIVGGVFLVTQLLKSNETASLAHVYYGSSNEAIVTIDFQKMEVVKNYDQDIPSSYNEDYPMIDEANQTITLLGDYEINGVRQIVVIQYDFGVRSVQIIEEQSPNNICSRDGVSYGKPLICLPNRVRVEFESNEDSDFTV